MILAALKNYLQENHIASLNELTTYFDIDPDTMHDMLEILIRKGQIQKIEPEKDHPCHKCAQCQMIATELYEWIGQ